MSAGTIEHAGAARPEPLRPHSRSRRWRVVRHALALTHRHLLHFARVPGLALWAIIQPIMFLLLFNFMFGSVISGGRGGYINFLVPGIVVQFLALIVSGTSTGVYDDISKGIVDRFRSLPIARSAVLSGRIISDALRCGFNIVLLATVGALLGFRPSTGAIPLMGAFLLAMVFGVALAWVGVWIGLTMRSLEAVQMVGIIWVVPMTFVSSLFVPTQTLPGWLQVIVTINPLTNVADALRALTFGGPAMGPVLASLAWTVGILITFSVLAVRRYRRIE